jgi:hypothetical protein
MERLMEKLGRDASRECETVSTSLRAQRSNPQRREKKEWIASLRSQ